MSMEERCARLRQYLTFLRDIGIVPIALYQPTEEAAGSNRGAPFQRLECIGDHNWGSAMARRIRLVFPHIDWMSRDMSGLFDTLRGAVESNSMLEHTCDVIGLQHLLPISLQSSSMKFKADLVEGLLGELYLAYWSCCPASMNDGRTRYVDVASGDGGVRAPLSSVISHVVNEILDVIVVATLSRNLVRIVPLLREYTVTSRFRRLEAPGEQRTSFARKSISSHVRLPAVPLLHSSATSPFSSERAITGSSSSSRANTRGLGPHHCTFHTRVATRALDGGELQLSVPSGWEMADRGVGVVLPFVAGAPSPRPEFDKGLL
jgi:hypothetical protein